MRKNVFILFNAHLPCRRVQHRSRWRWGSPWYFSVCLKLWWLQWVLLCLHHSNDSLLGPGVVADALLSGGVANVLGRGRLL